MIVKSNGKKYLISKNRHRQIVSSQCTRWVRLYALEYEKECIQKNFKKCLDNIKNINSEEKIAKVNKN